MFDLSLLVTRDILTDNGELSASLRGELYLDWDLEEVIINRKVSVICMGWVCTRKGSSWIQKKATRLEHRAWGESGWGCRLLACWGLQLWRTKAMALVAADVPQQEMQNSVLWNKPQRTMSNQVTSPKGRLVSSSPMILILRQNNLFAAFNCESV